MPVPIRSTTSRNGRPLHSRFADARGDSDVESEQEYVSVSDDVLLAFRPDRALLAGTLPAIVRHEVVVAHSLGPNESPLEVRVNHRRRLRGAVADVNRPRAHFLLAGGEVGLQAKQAIARMNQPVETGRLETQ